jgi:hypothetical protein
MRSSCVIPASDESGSASWRARRSTLVLTNAGGSGLLAARPHRVADSVLARAFSFRLDRRLAAGEDPDSSRLLATRAQHLVSVATRQAVADSWEHLLARARHAPAPGHAAMAIRADRVLAAEPDVLELIAHLRTALPVAARGVAAARVLLTDGAGPVYHRRAATGLRDALHAAVAHLEPWTPLFASS